MSNSQKIDKLESQIETLKQTIITLEQTISKLKEELNLFKFYSSDTTRQVYKIRELEEANFDLKTIIGRKELDFKLEKNRMETKYKNDLNKLKDEIYLINHKYDAMLRYELYITKIEEYNKELQKKINDLEKEYELGIKSEEMKYKINLRQVQQKTLNILGESKKNIQSNAMKNLNNSYKLIMMQVNELYGQLAEQSLMMEELLKTMNKKDKIIRSLKINITVNKEVEKIILVQNRKLSKLFKKLLEEKKQFGEKEYNNASKKFLRILKNEDDLIENENENENSDDNDNYNDNEYNNYNNYNNKLDNEDPNKILFKKRNDYISFNKNEKKNLNLNKNLKDISPSKSYFLNNNNNKEKRDYDITPNDNNNINNNNNNTSRNKSKIKNLFSYNTINSNNKTTKNHKGFNYNSSTKDEINSSFEQKSFNRLFKESQIDSDVSKLNNLNMNKNKNTNMNFNINIKNSIDSKKGNFTSSDFFKIPKNLTSIEVKDIEPKEKKDKIFKESEFNRKSQILDEYSKTLNKPMKFLAIEN
jgi:hypothetical protein